MEAFSFEEAQDIAESGKLNTIVDSVNSVNKWIMFSMHIPALVILLVLAGLMWANIVPPIAALAYNGLFLVIVFGLPLINLKKPLSGVQKWLLSKELTRRNFSFDS
jgi:hypothetical protein